MKTENRIHKLGYVDYQLDNFHANIYLKLLREDLKSRGWEVAQCWAMNETGGRKWASEKGVAYVTSVEQMRDCDALMVLAPSNPETHWELARRALPLGLPTYIDKTFAPDHRTARRIFALADKHRAPVITSSALRCAASLQRAVAELGRDHIRHMRAWGGGRSFAEYAIHPLEMVISVMGPEVRRLMRLTDGQHDQILLLFTGDRTANVFVHTQSDCPFQAMLSTNQRTVHVNTSGDPIFRDLASFILDFFESRRELIDRRESLAIAKVLEKAADKRSWARWVTL